MKSLGTLLVKHSWITKQQLGLAISKQREIGGRLGTCLLEMGAIEEDLLDRCLAEQQGVPVASAKSLKDIPDKVSQLLPAPIAIRYRAVPFGAGHSEVDIAMLEVDNLWLQDELSFIIGRRLNVYITNEARVAEALSTYYGAPISERFAQLLDRLNRHLQERAAATPHPQSRLVNSDSIPTVEEKTPSRPKTVSSEEESVRSNFQVVEDRSSTPLIRARSIPVSTEELETLGAFAPAGGSSDIGGQVVSPYSRDHQSTVLPISEHVNEELQSVSRPDEVGKILLSVLSQEFTRTMLLKASQKGVRGWLAHGPGIDMSRFKNFEVSFEDPSIFLNLREGGSFYLGLLPEMPPHLEMAACWNKDLSDECVVFPIRVRERLVTLVYGDRGPLGLADLDLNKVRQLTSAASDAFELCIIKQKDKKRQVSSG
jgi:hypothetical protein